MAPKSVGTKQLKKQAVTDASIRSDTITGASVLESSLGKVPAAAHAGHAATADTATNVATVGGVSASAFGTTATFVGVDFKPRESTTAYAHEPNWAPPASVSQLVGAKVACTLQQEAVRRPRGRYRLSPKSSRNLATRLSCQSETGLRRP